MKKNNLIVYPGSNRMGQPLTKNDHIRKNNAFNVATERYDQMDFDKLEEIERSNTNSETQAPVYFENGKKLTGVYYIAFQHSILKRKYNLKDEQQVSTPN